MTSTEHLRRDDVETRPSASKIRLQMTDSSRIPLIDDFGRNRRLRIPIASVLLNCYTANAIASMLTLRCQTIEWPELLVLSALYTTGLRGRGARESWLPPPRGVDYKSTRAQLSVSLFRPRELLATSYGLFLKETSHLHIYGTPYRTAS